MTQREGRAFASREQLATWLKKNHATSSELWVRMFKKGSGRPSVTWDDCVVVAIAWGWIDGVRHALDEESFLQRFTPRRARSNWSKRNCAHAERLIAEGKMEPAGLAHVVAARADGRWDRAYASSSNLVFPEEFMLALKKAPKAAAFFATLSRVQRFPIYYSVQTAKRADTRTRRIAAAVAALTKGQARAPRRRSTRT